MNTDSESAPNRTTAYDEGGPTETAADKPSGPRYSLRNLHAAGGIGEIWLARDLDLDRDVAVKKLQSQRTPSEMTKARFLREARITGQLDHPGVVPVYEICHDEMTSLRLPSALRATLRTAAACPLKVCSFWPVAESHRAAVRSADPVRTRLPSPLTATLLTPKTCPLKIWSDTGRASCGGG